MSLAFEKLPRNEKIHLINWFGLPEKEAKLLTLRYVNEFNYSRIAAELHISEKSIGALLTRARKHTVEIAKECFPIADEHTQKLIIAVGWDELDWPTLQNRRKK